MLCDPTTVYSMSQDHSWISVGNDSILSRRDDYLTAEGAIHLAGMGWAATIDDQMLTQSDVGLRTDQISATVGRPYAAASFYLDGEIGLLTDGNLSGKTIQNAYHKSRGIHLHGWSYDERQRHAALATIAVSWTVGWLQVHGVASATPKGCHVEPTLAIGGPNARLSLGYLIARGHEPSEVADAVDTNQRGFQASIGATVDHVAMSATISGRAVLWTTGVVF